MIGNTLKKNDEFCFEMTDLGFPGWNVVKYLCLDILDQEIDPCQ